MDPATIDATSFRLRAQGAGADVPASVTLRGRRRRRSNPNADLEPGAIYEVTVAGARRGHQPAIRSAATTPGRSRPPGCRLTDTTSADFGGGTTGADTYVSETDNGEVILKPTAGAEFGGSALPGGWTSAPWSAGGGATVAGGRLHVDGASAGTTRDLRSRALAGVRRDVRGGAVPDRRLRHRSQCPAVGDVQHPGRQPVLRPHHTTARVSTNTPLPSSLLGSAHRYRIEWDAGEVRFFVDDNLVVTHTADVRGQHAPADAATSTPVAPGSRSTGCE